MDLSYIRQSKNIGKSLTGISTNYTKTFVLVDENTAKHCLPLIDFNFDGIIEIPPGEKNKNIKQTEKIWNKLIEFEADKNSLLVNLGGGVITDIGGYAASTFLRGINFINIPTTLLCMVDAAIGGKNGVNYKEIKNFIGTINQPKLVLVNHLFLKTLAAKEILSGFAEMLKHGLISNIDHFLTLNKIDKNELLKNLTLKLISQSAQIKMNVVVKDVNDAGMRRILNFGHTIGHAIESAMLGKVTHGAAVAAGMYCETIISYNKGLIGNNTKNEVLNTIRKYYKPLSIKGLERKIEMFCHKDKKNKAGVILMVCLSDIGQSKIDIPVNSEEILKSLHLYQ